MSVIEEEKVEPILCTLANSCVIRMIFKVGVLSVIRNYWCVMNVYERINLSLIF